MRGVVVFCSHYAVTSTPVSGLLDLSTQRDIFWFSSSRLENPDEVTLLREGIGLLPYSIVAIKLVGGKTAPLALAKE